MFVVAVEHNIFRGVGKMWKWVMRNEGRKMRNDQCGKRVRNGGKNAECGTAG